MSDPRNTPPQPPFFDPMDPPMSPEELEAAAAANEADAAAQLDNALGEVETLKTKVAELTDQALRAQAEAQNARRRADDEIAKIRKFAVESFAESLLPVLDSLEAGLKVTTPAPNNCAKAPRPRCASCWPRWSATRWSR